MSKTIKIPGRIESVATGKVVTGANFILDDTKGKKQNVINEETDAELLRLDQEKQGNLTFDQTPTEDSTNPVTSGGVYAADQMLSQAIEAILLLIPSAASELNKLVDLATMNSSISTATASFKGTYNLVSDLHLTVSATHAQIAAALDALSLGADNNDYAFVQVPNTDTAPTDIAKTERYKFNGENWAYEYDLNNSGFTTAQWNAINSGITTLLVAKLLALPTNEALTLALAGKQNNLTFDNAPTAGSNNPVKSSGIYTRNNEIVALINALDVAKQNVLTFDTTPTNGSTNPVTSNGVYLAIQLVQTAVVALDGRMGTAETKISTAEGNIVNLQAAYAALTQSDIVVVSGALPSSGQQQNIIYRQPDQDHTPPQFYSDYMWNGTAWVLMATYNNAIDQRPKKGSQNLVTSGGVFDNMGALDVSELNATENPHTLKPYATLDAALADIPSDYQKGGMSIKYVQTSDNNYIQFRCKSQSFSTDPEDWAICDDGTYIESTEFLRVETDNNDKILWGIRLDGSFYFGEGCPKQVKDYVIYNLGTKVDKILGKGLSTNDYTDSDKEIVGINEFVDDPRYLKITLDKDKRLLFAIKKNGEFVWGVGVPAVIKEYIENIVGSIYGTKDYSGSIDTLNKIYDYLMGLPNRWGNKKVSIIGDSISTFNQEGYKIDGYAMFYPTSNPSDRAADVTSVEDTWWKKLLNNTNNTIDINASYSGSGAATIDGRPNFPDRVPLLNNPDIVYVALGTNDSGYNVEIGDIDYDAVSYDTTKFAPAYIKGIQEINRLYPYAKIVCIAFDMAFAYRTTIETIAKHYGCEFIYVGDISNVHPNKEEMQLVSVRVTRWYKYNLVDELKDIRKELVENLPVSDGTNIGSGHAYIDSTDRCVKVKA